MERRKSWADKVRLSKNCFLRCKEVENFSSDFYQFLFFLNPKTKAYFHQTDFEHQEKALIHGIEFLFQYLELDDEARTQVKRLAIVHSQKSLNIHPHHYYYWIEALILTLKKHDPKWFPELEFYLRECISFPVNFMVSLYFYKEY